jgi:predicted DNA-binding transcriptional regulator AlpA
MADKTIPVLIPRRRVGELYGLQRSAIYQRIALGTFPKPVTIGSAAVRWIESEFTAWIEQQINASRERQPAKREREALEQQRAHLVIALAVAEQSARYFLPGSLEHGKAKSRVTLLHNELRLMRGKFGAAKKRPNLSDLLVEICRERVTPAEWRNTAAEAQRRHCEQEPLSTVSGMLAGTTRCNETDDPPAALRLDNN